MKSLNRESDHEKNTFSINQAIGLAARYHAAGDLREADNICQNILQREPNQPLVLHLLGIIAHQLDKNDIAVNLIRKALTVQPDYAEAHNNLGITLQGMGRLDEAVASYNRALAFKPDYAEAHYNLGYTLKELHKLDEAAASYRNAIAIRPDYSEAHHNLGSTLRDLGRPDEAATSFRAALAIEPDCAEAHNNLGVTLKELNKLDEAVASYRKALAIKPDYAEAHNNLGVTLKELDNLDEALTCYRQALAINPDYAEAHNNLGYALRDLGRLDEALGRHRRAISLSPENNVFWAGLAQIIEVLTFTSFDDSLCQDLARLLKRPSIRPSSLVQPVISALRHHPAMSHAFELMHSETPETEMSYGETAERLSAIPLFLVIMELSPISDLAMERMLTYLRHALLKETMAGQMNERGLAFSASLALQCFTNEYIYPETDEEAPAVERLQRQIAVLVDDDRDIAPILVAALGAYRPLHKFPWAHELCHREWCSDITKLIERQISEPLIEQSLRANIRCLTPIQDAVSQSVRAQYEENPYPRWIKADTTDRGRPVGAILRGFPLHLNIGDYVSPNNPEILVAGCGTGQHPLGTASKFIGAQVLAVDLSLSSLTYALRKTDEFGISNVEYAQGDILELGNLGRQFDLIECIGVLHHLRDPMAGWRVLADLLRPGGLMMIGLYSEIARQDIVEGRALIADAGYGTSPEKIRRCRQDIIAMAEDNNPEMAALCGAMDFFNLSSCRDMLFHVQEHRYTLPQIEQALTELKLNFIGFEIRNQSTLKKFRSYYPQKQAYSSLSHWHKFELEYPHTFRGMYQFWCQKL
jgi:tetratricopeptide (TPR) repeat protein